MLMRASVLPPLGVQALGEMLPPSQKLRAPSEEISNGSAAVETDVESCLVDSAAWALV